MEYFEEYFESGGSYNGPKPFCKTRKPGTDDAGKVAKVDVRKGRRSKGERALRKAKTANKSVDSIEIHHVQGSFGAVECPQRRTAGRGVPQKERGAGGDHWPHLFVRAGFVPRVEAARKIGER